MQMPTEESNVDSCAGAGPYQQALKLIRGNDVARLKDALASMDDSDLSETDSCGELSLCHVSCVAILACSRLLISCHPIAPSHCTAAMIMRSHNSLKCLTGRSLLHWGVLEGSDEVFEALLSRLHKHEEIQETQNIEHAPQLRKLLLRADHYSDNPITSAVRAHAAMKVCSVCSP